VISDLSAFLLAAVALIALLLLFAEDIEGWIKR
jgi:hypothetical protein